MKKIEDVKDGDVVHIMASPVVFGEEPVIPGALQVLGSCECLVWVAPTTYDDIIDRGIKHQIVCIRHAMQEAIAQAKRGEYGGMLENSIAQMREVLSHPDVEVSDLLRGLTIVERLDSELRAISDMAKTLKALREDKGEN